MQTTPVVPVPIQLAIQTCNCNRCVPFGEEKKCEQNYETMSQRWTDKLSDLKKGAKQTFAEAAQTIFDIRNNAEKKRKANEENLCKHAIPVFEHEMEKELFIFEALLEENCKLAAAKKSVVQTTRLQITESTENAVS